MDDKNKGELFDSTEIKVEEIPKSDKSDDWDIVSEFEVDSYSVPYISVPKMREVGEESTIGICPKSDIQSERDTFALLEQSRVTEKVKKMEDYSIRKGIPSIKQVDENERIRLEMDEAMQEQSHKQKFENKIIEKKILEAMRENCRPGEQKLAEERIRREIEKAMLEESNNDQQKHDSTKVLKEIEEAMQEKPLLYEKLQASKTFVKEIEEAMQEKPVKIEEKLEEAMQEKPLKVEQKLDEAMQEKPLKIEQKLKEAMQEKPFKVEQKLEAMLEEPFQVEQKLQEAMLEEPLQVERKPKESLKNDIEETIKYISQGKPKRKTENLPYPGQSFELQSNKSSSSGCKEQLELPSTSACSEAISQDGKTSVEEAMNDVLTIPSIDQNDPSYSRICESVSRIIEEDLPKAFEEMFKAINSHEVDESDSEEDSQIKIWSKRRT